MAFNPNTYESIYGSALFDEIHNFFPEFMYDDSIFSAEPYLWMRYRLNTLFPQTYIRQRTLYNIYQAVPRRTQYETWRFQNFPAVASRIPPRASNPHRSEPVLVETLTSRFSRLPLRSRTETHSAPPPTVVPHTVPSASTETRTDTVEQNNVSSRSGYRIQTQGESLNVLDASGARTYVRAPSTRTYAAVAGSAGSTVASIESPVNEIVSGLIRGMFDEIHQHTGPRLNQTMRYTDDTGLLSLLTAASMLPMSDVPIVATTDIIERNSVIVEHSSIPTETTCAVCQELYNETSTDTTWRKLNCAHYFHRPCIDRWFERNVVCPVCRHDIRDMASPAPSTSTVSSPL